MTSNSTVQFKIIFSMLALILAVSCGAPQKNQLTEEEMIILEDLAKTAEDLPPPSLVPKMLTQIGAGYYTNIINDLGKLEMYKSDKDKAALNLGIYISDITYLINYDKIADTEDHMDACHELGELLGVHTVFNPDLTARYEANIKNHDALNDLMDEVFKGAAVDSSESLTMSGLVLTGSFVEGLYMIIKVLEDFPETNMTHAKRDQVLEPLVLLLLDQRKPLLDIVKLLRDLPQDDSIAWMLAELSILERLFRADLADIEEKMQTRPEGFVVSQNMLLDIMIEVTRVRDKVTE